MFEMNNRKRATPVKDQVSATSTISKGCLDNGNTCSDTGVFNLEDDEKKMFLEDLGLTESGLEKLIAASYRLLGLMSFLTAGEDETRAWTIKVGTKAPQAAGKIHTDFERGFIKAEVVNYQDLLDCGSYAGAREKGLVRMEGKDYIVRDGDVILFRFNV